eukprot:XP_028338301.1 armadillo repeat-containing X-linked protein 5 isoform X3 [Physeter catodon]
MQGLVSLRFREAESPSTPLELLSLSLLVLGTWRDKVCGGKGLGTPRGKEMRKLPLIQAEQACFKAGHFSKERKEEESGSNLWRICRLL